MQNNESIQKMFWQDVNHHIIANGFWNLALVHCVRILVQIIYLCHPSSLVPSRGTAVILSTAAQLSSVSSCPSQQNWPQFSGEQNSRAQLQARLWGGRKKKSLFPSAHIIFQTGVRTATGKQSVSFRKWMERMFTKKPRHCLYFLYHEIWKPGLEEPPSATSPSQRRRSSNHTEPIAPIRLFFPQSMLSSSASHEPRCPWPLTSPEKTNKSLPIASQLGFSVMVVKNPVHLSWFPLSYWWISKLDEQTQAGSEV